ncbi:MAG TPA: hypothetical protein VGE93_10125, partial [Bryobacteraceae bacterium]
KLRQQLSSQSQRQQGPQQQPGSQQMSSGTRGPAIPYSSIQEAASAMSGLRQQLGPRDRDLSRQLSGAVGALRHLDDSRAGEMEARLNREILPGLERLEAELSQRLGDATEAPRTTASETAPEQYRDAVARYFRRLSQ